MFFSINIGYHSEVVGPPQAIMPPAKLIALKPCYFIKPQAESLLAPLCNKLNKSFPFLILLNGPGGHSEGCALKQEYEKPYARPLSSRLEARN